MINNTFKLRKPREQFLKWMDEYALLTGSLPVSCSISLGDLAALGNGMGYRPKCDGYVLTLFGVALHIQEDKCLSPQ